MMLQANCAGVSNRVLCLETLKTSQLDALRLIHKYPRLSRPDCPTVALNGAQQAADMWPK